MQDDHSLQQTFISTVSTLMQISATGRHTDFVVGSWQVKGHLMPSQLCQRFACVSPLHVETFSAAVRA